MPPTIRPAVSGDIPLLHQLIRELALYENLVSEFEATESALQRDLFPTDGSAPLAYAVFAMAGDVPAGYALYFFNYSTFLARPSLYLEDLFVKPEFRAQGIGKALLVHLAKLANARGCGRMEWTVLDWNERAIAFYDSLGAHRLKEWKICRLTGEQLTRYR